jgi:hypothetical protein
LQCWLLLITFALHYTNSLLTIKEQEEESKQQIEFAVKFSSEVLHKFKCINFIAQSFAAQDVVSNIYRRSDFPVVIGQNNTLASCTDRFIIVVNKTEALLLVRQLHSGAQNKIILFSLEVECPEIYARIFLAMHVIVACSFTRSAYHLGGSGEFTALSEWGRFFEDKTTSLPNYMGRMLRVSTFNCPPFSYGIQGKFIKK